MTPSILLDSRPVPRWAMLTLLLVLIGGCGRKGPLFLPQEKLRQAEEALERRDAAPQTPPAPTAPSGQTAPNQPSPPR